MTDTPRIRAWYLSPPRLLELLDTQRLPIEIAHALRSPDAIWSKAVLANTFGAPILDFLQREKVPPFYRLAIEGQLRKGVPFTYEGHFYGKGFGIRNQTSLLSLSENVNDILPGKRLVIEFSKSGLVTDTARTRLSGSTNLFVFGSITEIRRDVIKAVPYLIGDLVEGMSTLGLRLSNYLRLFPQSIDQLKSVNFSWTPTREQFLQLKRVPEKAVKDLFARLLSEFEPAKDWGGEEADLFSSNLSVDGERKSAAFLLKGPSKFHEMKLTDCGKNGDQIVRLYNTPADVFVLQHCHKVSPAVRKTMEAFALSNYSQNRQYLIIDGYDTARILRHHGVLPRPTPRKRARTKRGLAGTL